MGQGPVSCHLGPSVHCWPCLPSYCGGLQSGDSDCEESTRNAGDKGSIPGLRKSSGEGNGYPLQYSCWRIPWTEEAGGLQSMGLQRVRHDCVTFTHSLTQKFKFRSSVQFSRSVVSDSLRPHEFKDTTKTGGEGNGNPLQYSCLEIPTDGGAW